MDKPSLRKTLIQTRKAIPPDRWQDWSRQICDHLRSYPPFHQAQTVLAYFSTRQEPDLAELFSLNKNWGFPRCIGSDLSWHTWSPQHSLPLNRGAFGIVEPHPDSPTIAPEAVDLLLVPAVACDRQGYRLGYGGGFYDRLLSADPWQQKPTIGIIFDFAYLEALPIDPWDRPLEAVVTERGIWVMGDG